MNKNILYTILILIAFIFTRSFNNNSTIITTVDNIYTTFHLSYKRSMICNQEKCFFNCIKRDENTVKFKEYSENDIPGRYPYNYSYLSNNKQICRKKTYLFISIITLCRDLEDRMAIRKVYENINKQIELHFFIGYSSKKCQNQFYEERNLFNDITQMPIVESYINQTIFTLYLHKILPIICPNADYYGKMDADQYINFTKLFTLLKYNYKYNSYFYSCFTWKFYYINTSKNYKYSSHKSVANYYKIAFPSRGVKGFTGSFGVWKNYLSKLIYQESLNEEHIIRMEDQHISWLIYRLKRKGLANISFYDLRCIEAGYKCQINENNIYGIHRLKGKELYSFYKLLNDAYIST